MKLLLSLIKKLYGSKALQKSIGTRTNVITLPDKETKKFISNELNIDAASDAAVQKAYKDVEKLIPEIPKMNDQEILTFTNNLRRLDNRLNPPSAEVVEFGTKKPVSEAGIKQLAAERGFPEGVDPESTMGRLLTSTRKLQDEAEKLKQQTPSQQFEDLLKNPYRSGGPLDPKSGIVRTAARQILRKKLDAGEIDIPDAAERDAIAKGYQGGVDPIEVFRKRFGEDPLQDLDEIADELNRAGDFNEIDKILKRNKLFDIEPKKDYVYQEGSYTDEEMAALLKKAEEDPEGFATGGRVGFQQGGNLDFNKFLEDRTREALQVEGIGQAIRPVVESNIRAKAARDLSQAARRGGIESFLKGQLGSGIIPGMFAIQSPMSGTSGFGRKLVLDALTKSYMKPYSIPTDSVYDQMRFAAPGQSGSFVEMPGGQFGDGMGIVIDGKRYATEQEAIDDVGLERYSMFYADGGRVEKGSPKIFDQLEMDVSYPYGHRVQYAMGSLPKGIQALVKMINKKFGKGTVKLGKDVKRPESAEIREAFMAFKKRNKLAGGGAVKTILKIIEKIKKLDPMDAMKEVNEVVAKRGKYKNLSDEDTQKIFEDTQDHIFEREYKPSEFEMNFDDVDEEIIKKPGSKPIKQGDPITSENFGESQFAPDTSDLEKARELAPKMAERFELKQKYPGLDDKLLTAIIDDPDPQRKAEAIAVIDQAFELMKRGKSPDEILEIMKKGTDRTKQAGGGLAYLMGL